MQHLDSILQDYFKILLSIEDRTDGMIEQLHKHHWEKGKEQRLDKTKNLQEDGPCKESCVMARTNYQVTFRPLFKSSRSYTFWCSKTFYGSPMRSGTRLFDWVTYLYCLLSAAYVHPILKSFSPWHLLTNLPYSKSTVLQDQSNY